MATDYGNKSIVTDGLVFAVDAANKQSWTGPSSNNVYNTMSTTVGSIINDTSGSYGDNNSFIFDGVDDSIDFTLPSQTLYHLNIWFSRTAGITTSQVSSNRTLLGWGESGTLTGIWFGAFTSAATDETILLYQNSQGSNNLTYIRDTADSNFHNLSINWNGSNYDMYLDGTSKTTYAGTVGHLSQLTINHLYLGRSNSSIYEHTGNISNCQIYNRALSASEVLQNYNALKSRFE